MQLQITLSHALSWLPSSEARVQIADLYECLHPRPLLCVNVKRSYKTLRSFFVTDTMSDDPVSAMVAASRELYDAIDRLDAVAADRIGIARNDLRALNALERGSKRPRDLAIELSLTTGAVTSLVDRLERRGLVVRAPDPDDRRGVLIIPTEKMFTVLAPLYRLVEQRVAALTHEYGTAQTLAAAQHVRDIAKAYSVTAERR